MYVTHTYTQTCTQMHSPEVSDDTVAISVVTIPSIAFGIANNIHSNSYRYIFAQMHTHTHKCTHIHTNAHTYTQMLQHSPAVCDDTVAISGEGVVTLPSTTLELQTIYSHSCMYVHICTHIHTNAQMHSPAVRGDTVAISGDAVVTIPSIAFGIANNIHSHIPVGMYVHIMHTQTH